MKKTWETKYAELMKNLREKRRKKMKYQEKGIPTTNKPSVSKSCRDRVVSVNRYFMVQKIRESRDYSFLFCDDSFEPNLKPSDATSRKTSSNVVVVGSDQLEETKKPPVSFKIKVTYNKIAPKNFTNKNGGVNKKEKNVGSMKNKISPQALQDSRKPYFENLERKKPNLEPKRRLLRQYWSDDDSDEEEAAKAFSIIRHMYNTKRFIGRDDRDMDMETNYGDLLKEEKKSEKIGRAEDREQSRLIMEEERRKKTKKC